MNHPSRMLALLVVFGTACGSIRSYTRDTPPPLPVPERYGSVEWVRETVQRPDGSITTGAALSTTVVAAETATTSHQSNKRYDVAVRFSDGTHEVFAFDGESPFSIGDQVAMTPAGLRRVGPAVAPLESPGLSIPLP